MEYIHVKASSAMCVKPVENPEPAMSRFSEGGFMCMMSEPIQLGGLFDQVPCLCTRPAVIVECFTRTGRRVLLCHCPAGMRCHGDILVALLLDQYAVKQAPRSCASFPDPLPSSAGGLSGPQVSARNACDKLQQESEMMAGAADAGLKIHVVPRKLEQAYDITAVPLSSMAFRTCSSG